MRDPEADLFDVALKVTDEALGEGTYADLHRTNGNPGVRAAIQRWQAARPDAHQPDHEAPGGPHEGPATPARSDR